MLRFQFVISVVIVMMKLKKVDGSEDEIKAGQEKVQKLTDKFVKEIDEIAKVKEKEIMTV